MRKGLLGKIIGNVAVIGTAGAIFVFLAHEAANTKEMNLRTDRKIESGYVQPKKLDITLEDQNKNGEKEVVLEYRSAKYALMEDEFGNPVLKRYEVKPAEEIPAQYIPPKIVIKD